MKLVNTTNWLKKLASAVGMTLACALISFPALARYNPYYSFFNPGYGLPESSDDPNLVEQLAGNNLTKFSSAMREAGLTQRLSQKDTFTILAPTDEAFATLPPGVWETLSKPENREIYLKVLNYHVVPGLIGNEALDAGQVRTIEGEIVKFHVTQATPMLNDARMTRAQPIAATNGVIVVIDKVLLPPDVAARLAVGAISSGQPASSNPVATTVNPSSRTSSITFACQFSATTNLPTTYAITPQGAKPLIRWNSEYFSEAGYTPEVRCQQVAARFQAFASSGQLKYLTSGYVNNQPAICVSSTQGSPCTPNTMLFTLKPGSDATERLRKLFNLRTGTASGSDVLYESSSDDDSFSIDFDKYLSSTTVENVGFPNTSPGAIAPSNVEQPNSPAGGGGLW